MLVAATLKIAVKLGTLPSCDAPFEPFTTNRGITAGRLISEVQQHPRQKTLERAYAG
jgi:hypothetical protein